MNDQPVKEDTFQTELSDLINRHSKENGSDTPDFVLAEYLNTCLKNFDYAVRYRESTQRTQANTKPNASKPKPQPPEGEK